jgi:hypothetical protein
MFAKIARSWALTKASAAVVRDEPRLLWFPVFTGLAAAGVIVISLIPMVGVALAGGLATDADGNVAGGGEAVTVVWVFLLYFALYFVGVFFNSALVAAALVRLQGGQPSIRASLALAMRRAPAILGYSVIAASVGLALRMIEERVGWVGRWVVATIGVAWSLATFLAVPVLVVRGVSPVAALNESGALLRGTWGENVAGNAGMAAAFMLAYLALAGIVVAFASLGSPTWIVNPILACVVAGALLVLFQSVLQGVFAAALYGHATGAAALAGFPKDLLDESFVTRR